MTTMPAVLAIDGGNSKTDLALVGSDGTVLAAVRGGGSCLQRVGRDGMLRVLGDLVQSAAAAVGLPADGPVAAHTSACLAGADLPDEEVELGALIAAQGWSATTSVVNDTFAVLRAGMADAGPYWGIAAVCGAGINCTGVGPDGRTARFLSLGSISGDWGGGGDLGSDSLWWAIRAEDGRGPQTELRTAVAKHFGVADVTDVVTGIYFGKIDYSELHELVPVLFEVASRGDEVARSLVLRQADEICLMVLAAARKLDLVPDAAAPGVLPAAAIPVVLGGSIMTARDPLLSSAITDRLKAELPGADVRTVDVPPVVGAALLGLDHADAPPSAAVRLRAEAQRVW